VVGGRRAEVDKAGVAAEDAEGSEGELKRGKRGGEKRGGRSGFAFQREADGSRLEKSELQEDIS